MDNNENVAAEQAAAEQKTEPKLFTQDEVNDIVRQNVGRNTAKLTKQFEKKYESHERLAEVLRAGTGKEDLGEITSGLESFYTGKGVELPKGKEYSEKDISILADADAKEIIGNGIEDVAEEVDRLAAKGLDKLNPREKRLFKTLADYRKAEEARMAYAEIGVSEEEYNSTEFREFASQFSPTTPPAKIYEIYEKTKPKPDIKPMGSMKDTAPPGDGIKDFYTVDEARKFTADDLRKNPALEQKILESMQKWGRG